MLNRHKVRILVLQSLFEVDYNSIENIKETLEVFYRLVEDGKDELTDKLSEFADILITGVISKKKELDDIIIKVAPAWPINKIPSVDKNILRIAIFEILFGKDFETPARVAINEAIEIAKVFGNEGTSKFINGVLGTVYKSMGEPEEDVKVRELKKSIGVLPYIIEGDDVKFAMINDAFNKWTLAKSKVDEGENDDVAVTRILKEKMGIDCSDEIKEIGKNAYTSHNPETGPIRNEVKYYLSKCDNSKIKLKESGGLKDAGWFTHDEIKELSMYKDLKQIIYTAADSVIKDEG